MIVMAETAEDMRTELLLWLRAREREAAETASRVSGTTKVHWDTAVVCYQEFARELVEAEIERPGGGR
jgi:hypothetical protein